MSAPVVARYPDQAELVAAAAQRFVDVVTAAQATRGSAAVVLTGGGTGIALLAQVRAQPGDIDWPNIDIYWGDERFVPAGDPQRNELQAREALLDHVPVDPARVHPIAAAGDTDVDTAAKQYAALLPDTFDLHLLGIGVEGHMNSLFPHTSAIAEEHALAVAVTDSPKPPPVRVTLTLPAIRRARQVMLVVAGTGKAAAVAAALAGASPADVPCAGAHGSEATIWLLDQGAASALG